MVLISSMNIILQLVITYEQQFLFTINGLATMIESLVIFGIGGTWGNLTHHKLEPLLLPALVEPTGRIGIPDPANGIK